MIGSARFPATAILSAALVFACATAPASATRKIEQLVFEEERAHLSQGLDPRSLIDVIVGKAPFLELGGRRFYAAYNSAADPSISYVVAVDGRGELYRLRGFSVSDDARFFGGLIADRTPILDVVDAYFRVVEEWTAVEGPIVREGRVTADLHDAASGRVERVTVALSPAKGVSVLTRTVIVDRQRTRS